MHRQQVSPYTGPLGVSLGAQWAPERFLWYAVAERHQQAADGTFPFNNGVGPRVRFHPRRRLQGPLAYRTGEHTVEAFHSRVQPPRTRVFEHTGQVVSVDVSLRMRIEEGAEAGLHGSVFQARKVNMLGLSQVSLKTVSDLKIAARQYNSCLVCILLPHRSGWTSQPGRLCTLSAETFSLPSTVTLVSIPLHTNVQQEKINFANCQTFKSQNISTQ
jgi:hypothetical protein